MKVDGEATNKLLKRCWRELKYTVRNLNQFKDFIIGVRKRKRTLTFGENTIVIVVNEDNESPFLQAMKRTTIEVLLKIM